MSVGARALTGPTADPGRRVQLINAPGAEVGPGQAATWGVVEADQVGGFDFSRPYRGGSSKHFPFDWRPEEQAFHGMGLAGVPRPGRSGADANCASNRQRGLAGISDRGGGVWPVEGSARPVDTDHQWDRDALRRMT